MRTSTAREYHIGLMQKLCDKCLAAYERNLNDWNEYKDFVKDPKDLLCKRCRTKVNVELYIEHMVEQTGCTRTEARRSLVDNKLYKKLMDKEG